MRKILGLTAILFLMVTTTARAEETIIQAGDMPPENGQHKISPPPTPPEKIAEQIKKETLNKQVMGTVPVAVQEKIEKEATVERQGQTPNQHPALLPPAAPNQTVIEPKPINPKTMGEDGFDAPVPVDFIPPEMPTNVQLSNRDINRIICPGPMSDLIFSEEKGISGHFAGNNAFVKFRAEDTNGVLAYANMASELFVVCNGAVYTLIADPQDIPSVTINLVAPSKEGLQKNIEHYKNMPLEKQVLQVIREAYEATYLPSYKVTKEEIPMPMCGDLSITQTITLDVEGVGLRLMEYRAINTTGNDIEIREKDFLDMDYSEAMIAVAIEDHVLPPQGATRIFVVENREQAR